MQLHLYLKIKNAFQYRNVMRKKNGDGAELVDIDDMNINFLHWELPSQIDDNHVATCIREHISSEYELGQSQLSDREKFSRISNMGMSCVRNTQPDRLTTSGGARNFQDTSSAPTGDEYLKNAKMCGALHKNLHSVVKKKNIAIAWS